MSSNPEFERPLGVAVHPNGLKQDTVEEPVATVRPAEPPPAVPAPVMPPPVIPPPVIEVPAVVQAAPAPVGPAPAKPSRRRGWMLPGAIGAIGLIVVATLGFFLVSTMNQRDSVQRQLTSSQAALALNQGKLTSTQADLTAASGVVTYMTMYTRDMGAIQTDYESAVACTDYSTCRTALQQMLTDLQTFQSDRASATVPSKFANSNAMLGDGLSAAIAAMKQFITALDTGDANGFKAAAAKVDAAFLSIAKAQAALGAELKS